MQLNRSMAPGSHLERGSIDDAVPCPPPLALFDSVQTSAGRCATLLFQLPHIAARTVGDDAFLCSGYGLALGGQAVTKTEIILIYQFHMIVPRSFSDRNGPPELMCLAGCGEPDKASSYVYSLPEDFNATVEGCYAGGKRICANLVDASSPWGPV
jgi:hypothetical protein